MKFLICPASKDQLDTSSEYNLFKKGDEYYNYMVELEPEDNTVRITDCIGRMVPFDTSELDDIINMLDRINLYTKNTKSLNDYLYSCLIQGASL